MWCAHAHCADWYNIQQLKTTNAKTKTKANKTHLGISKQTKKSPALLLLGVGCLM